MDKSTQQTQGEQITQMMRHGLPNHQYLEFVARYITLGQSTSLVDPFAITVSSEHASDLIVDRSRLTNETSRASSQFILGLGGSGKTTVFEQLPDWLEAYSPHPLVVSLPIDRIGLFPSSAPAENNRIDSWLTMELLAQHIFDTLWEKQLRDPEASSYEPQLLQNAAEHKAYWERFRWFYHRYPPRYPGSERNFAMLAWLKMPPKEVWNDALPAHEVLRQLVKLVTYNPTIETFGRVPKFRPYDSIFVLIDGTESLPPPALKRLLRDIQKLHASYIEGLYFKVCLNSTWQPTVQKLECVREGRISIYQMPGWSSEELKDLLEQRLLLPFENAPWTEPLQNWLKPVPANSLDPDKRQEIAETINKHAIEASGLDGLDAPIHVLRLARVVLAACAGCFIDLFDPAIKLPLSVDDIEKLCLQYRGKES